MQHFTATHHPDSITRARLHDIETYRPLLEPILRGLNWSTAKELEPAVGGWLLSSLYPGGGSVLLLGRIDAWMQLLWLDSSGVVVAEHTLPGGMELADAVEALREELGEERGCFLSARSHHPPETYVNFSLGGAMPLRFTPAPPPLYSAFSFIQARCTRTQGAQLLHGELLKAYRLYCADHGVWGLGERELTRQLSRQLHSCTSSTGERAWLGAKLNASPHTSVEQAAAAPEAQDAAAPEAQETPCAAEKSGQAQDTPDRLREMVGLSAAAWRAARSVLDSSEDVQRTERELEAARRQLKEAQDELRSAEARIVNHAPEHTP